MSGGLHRMPGQDQTTIACPLLGGEEWKEMFNDLTFLCPYNLTGIKGCMVLTNYRIYFKSFPQDAAVGGSGGGGAVVPAEDSIPTVLDVPLGFISQLQKMGGQRTSGKESYGLEIVCKDIRTLRFIMNKKPTDSATQRGDILEKIRAFCFPSANQFATLYRDTFTVDGWSVYNPKKEYERMGVNKPNTSWKINDTINARWKLCETYPRVLVVPKDAEDTDLFEVAKFRSKGRIPVLSWIHPDSQATICRSSQPLVGPMSNRSEADERMVQRIMEANAQSNRICIFDARPRRNAMANIVNGGGYEEVSFYDDTEFEFLDIHNIHVMRESLRKVKEVCFPTIDDKKLLSNIDNTQWLHHLRCILNGAIRILEKVNDRGCSVIVHCSDGWDRTAQLTSLTMLLMDPYYRTLEGFQVLIEKEWLSFGHKFAHRIGHWEDKHNGNERSPVFLQFVDCVWQVTMQFPMSFQFNESFLILILDHLYSCLFGTFLYNSDKERHLHKVKDHMQSLWSFVAKEQHYFINPTYRGPEHAKVLKPRTSINNFLLWKSYFCRWNPTVASPDPKAIRKNNARQSKIMNTLMGKSMALTKELNGKLKMGDHELHGSDDVIDEDCNVTGLEYRRKTSAEMGGGAGTPSSHAAAAATSPVSLSSSSSAATTTGSSSGASRPPPTLPPPTINASSYYSNLSSAAAAASVIPPPLPARGGGGAGAGSSAAGGGGTGGGTNGHHPSSARNMYL